MNPASEALHGMYVGPLAVASYRGQTLPHRERQDLVVELVHRNGRFRLSLGFSKTVWPIASYWDRRNAYAAFQTLTGVDLTLPGLGVMAS